MLEHEELNRGLHDATASRLSSRTGHLHSGSKDRFADVKEKIDVVL